MAYRRDANLCDALVHSKTNRTIQTNERSCPEECEYCKIISCGPIQDTNKCDSYNTQKDVNCGTRNVVYGIICTRCDVVAYVGETGRQLKERMTEHLRSIRLRHDVPIAAHFDSLHSHTDLQFQVLERLFRVYVDQKDEYG